MDELQSDLKLNPLLFPGMLKPSNAGASLLLTALSASRHFDVLPKKGEAAQFHVTGHMNVQCSLSLLRIIFSAQVWVMDL